VLPAECVVDIVWHACLHSCPVFLLVAAADVAFDGVAQAWQVSTFSWAGATTNGASVTLKLNDRVYITKT